MTVQLNIYILVLHFDFNVADFKNYVAVIQLVIFIYRLRLKVLKKMTNSKILIKNKYFSMSHFYDT